MLAHHVAELYPADYPKNFSVGVESYVDNVVGDFKATSLHAGRRGGLAVAIACANVANLLLARATAREKEMAVRTALGASRGRIVRQLLVESLILAVGGASLGCALAYGGIKMLVSAIPDGAIPQEAVIGLNVHVLLFSLGVAVFTALLFGLAPALQWPDATWSKRLRDSAKGRAAASGEANCGTLVVIEVALSLVLLSGAGLLMRSFIACRGGSRLRSGQYPGRAPAASQRPVRRAAAKQRFFRPLLARLSAMPGVVAATETSTLPPYGGIRSEIEIPGKTHTEKWQTNFSWQRRLCPTLGLTPAARPLAQTSDVNGARKVAVVNQTFVQKFLGPEDPLGKQIKLSFMRNHT